VVHGHFWTSGSSGSILQRFGFKHLVRAKYRVAKYLSSAFGRGVAVTQSDKYTWLGMALIVYSDSYLGATFEMVPNLRFKSCEQINVHEMNFISLHYVTY